jgi:hypothetical protein
LAEAFGRADEINRERLFDIVGFFYNEAPSPCWGSPQKMTEWARSGGLLGQRAPGAGDMNHDHKFVFPPPTGPTGQMLDG